jgi:voltage-gated potassium channel
VIARRLLSAEGVRDAAVRAVLTVLGGGAAFKAVETEQPLTTWDGVWWAATTVTTVGYGDVSPTTDAGRVIAMVVMVVGIGFVALLTAAAAERFIRRGGDPPAVDARLEEVSARLAAIERRLR